MVPSHAAMADEFIHATGASVVERVELAARPARFALPPERYRHGVSGSWLRDFLNGSEQVYAHQATALSALETDNVVLSTATASGKSLVFMASAIAELSTGHGRILVLYPQKALIGDQLARWQVELARAGLPPSLVGEITGEVPRAQRELVLDTARVILATPDVLHAWLMPMAQAPSVRKFLGALSLIAIDEAHVLDGVFGTNFSFFFRRLQQARLTALRLSPGVMRDLRVLATTATLRDPVAHLEILTGLPFVGIGEEDNGSPSQGVMVLHIEGPDRGAPAERTVAEMIAAIFELMPADASVISFADSRQGIERIARAVDRPDFAPYRQGYSAKDRRKIEERLRAGQYRGAGATSALELGIDMRQFAYGINLGIPDTAKSLRQRIGRVGRTRPGLFIVIGPSSAFTALGTSLKASLTQAVEPSPMYAANRFIQFQQACCFLAEGLDQDEATSLDPVLHWPEGFAEMLELAKPGALRPRDLQDFALLGQDSPHLAYSLRSMPSVTYALKHARTGDLIGTIDQQKALRETYPGGTYYHLGAPYRVTDWRTTPYENAIRILPQKSAAPTQPVLRSQVGASLEADALIDDRLQTSELGSFFETQLRVVESVEGYRIGRTVQLYRDLKTQDQRLSRKQREYQTTGIVLQIKQPWFAGDADHQVAARRSFADALKALLVHEYGIAPGELQTAHCGIAMHSAARAQKVDDAIAIFDTVTGGLRLTAPLFSDFAIILELLKRAVTMAGAEAPVTANNLERMERWFGSLTAAVPASEPMTPEPGKIAIYAPGSRVGICIRGQALEREILEPQFITLGDEEKLMYRYDAGAGAFGWVASEQIVPMGNDWRRAFWDPLSNEIELMAGDA